MAVKTEHVALERKVRGEAKARFREMMGLEPCEAKCGRCAYWVLNRIPDFVGGPEDVGYCRRFPPIRHYDYWNEPHSMAAYPLIGRCHSICGEFKKRETLPPEDHDG